MSIFCCKKLTAPLRLGKYLQETRENQKMSLGHLSSASKIPIKYIDALEKNQFHKLPKAKAFRLAYLRSCARALSLDENDIIDQFSTEGGWVDCEEKKAKKPAGTLYAASLSVLIRNLLIAAFVALFLSYLIWQVKGILQPPRLTIFSPPEGSVTTQLSTLVQGKVEKESRLTINGREIRIKEGGQFESMVDLSNGVNTITISATKKHGKTTTVTRHVVAKPAMSNAD